MHRLVTVLLALICVSPLHASVEDTCTGVASETEKCLYFFKGYLFRLSEASATPSEAITERETFMQRALRTRLGVVKDRGSDGGAQPGYCLPDQSSLAVIAGQLQETLAADTARWKEENDPILAAMQHTFPC